MATEPPPPRPLPTITTPIPHTLLDDISSRKSSKPLDGVTPPKNSALNTSLLNSSSRRAILSIPPILTSSLVPSKLHPSSPTPSPPPPHRRCALLRFQYRSNQFLLSKVTVQLKHGKVAVVFIGAKLTQIDTQLASKQCFRVSN